MAFVQLRVCPIARLSNCAFVQFIVEVRDPLIAFRAPPFKIGDGSSSSSRLTSLSGRTLNYAGRPQSAAGTAAAADYSRARHVAFHSAGGDR
jgi:hypothetical protein